MTNWVDHKLTITGPEMELKRFESCFVKAKEGDLFPRYYSDEFNGEPVERPEGEFYFSFDKLVPRPEDSDEWVLARWGNRFVACKTKIETLPDSIKLSFCTAWSFGLTIYAELAELFPLLTMEGDFYEYGFCIAGDIRCHGGKPTYVDKSEELAAKMEAWEQAG